MYIAAAKSGKEGVEDLYMCLKEDITGGVKPPGGTFFRAALSRNETPTWQAPFPGPLADLPQNTDWILDSLRGHPVSPGAYAGKLASQGRRGCWPKPPRASAGPFELSSFGDMGVGAKEEIEAHKAAVAERKAREEEERLRKEQEEEEERRRIAAEEAEKKAIESGAKVEKKEDKKDKKDKKKDDKNRVVVPGLLFPGQGAESPGMIDETVQALPAVQDILKRAKAVLNYDVIELLHGGNLFWVGDQRMVQPLVYVADMVALEKLKSENPDIIDKAVSCAGFSIGEYAALTAAGVWSFEDGLKLVQARGDAVQTCATSGAVQGMLSVIGLEESKLTKLCNDCAAKHGSCQIACSMFPEGFSVGGFDAAITELDVVAKRWGAQMTTIIGKQGAFHGPLMKPALEKIEGMLDSYASKMSPPNMTVWMSAGAEAVRPGDDPSKMIALLKKHMTSRLMWEETMVAMIADGANTMYECGPTQQGAQKQLRTMLRRINKEVMKYTINIEL